MQQLSSTYTFPLSVLVEFDPNNKVDAVPVLVVVKGGERVLSIAEELANSALRGWSACDRYIIGEHAQAENGDLAYTVVDLENEVVEKEPLTVLEIRKVLRASGITGRDVSVQQTADKSCFRVTSLTPDSTRGRMMARRVGETFQLAGYDYHRGQQSTVVRVFGRD